MTPKGSVDDSDRMRSFQKGLNGRHLRKNRPDKTFIALVETSKEDRDCSDCEEAVAGGKGFKPLSHL